VTEGRKKPYERRSKQEDRARNSEETTGGNSDILGVSGGPAQRISLLMSTQQGRPESLELGETTGRVGAAKINRGVLGETGSRWEEGIQKALEGHNPLVCLNVGRETTKKEGETKKKKTGNNAWEVRAVLRKRSTGA